MSYTLKYADEAPKGDEEVTVQAVQQDEGVNAMPASVAEGGGGKAGEENTSAGGDGGGVGGGGGRGCVDALDCSNRVLLYCSPFRTVLNAVRLNGRSVLSMWMFSVAEFGCIFGAVRFWMPKGCRVWMFGVVRLYRCLGLSSWVLGVGMLNA